MIGLFLCSCEDFLTEETETGVTNNNFWKDAKDVDAAVNGMLATFRDYQGSDVVVHQRDRGALFDVLGTWTNPCNNDLSRSWSSTYACIVWSNQYHVVASANLVLDNIHRADLTTERYNFYLGQALATRAYVYFYILENWGDAPLILHAEDVGMKARTPWQGIAEQCIEDLKAAAGLLPCASDLVDIDGRAITSKQVFSKGTCQAVLAHLYAWKAALNKEPELNRTAILYCDSVISDNSYQLAGSVKEVCEKVILGNSAEGILECDYKDTEFDLKNFGSYMASYCQRWPIVPLTTPSTSRARGLCITNSTVYAMYPDKNDSRRDEYFYKLDSMANVSTSITRGWAYVQKYRHAVAYTSGSQIGSMRAYLDNEILIRLADIILLRAELKAKTGDEAGAIKDLNRIRERAGCSPYSAGIDGDLPDAIQDERDREFFCEGLTIHYFDVVRNGTFRERLRGKFKTLTDKDVEDGALFLPVSRLAFRNNTLMLQTPYWKRNGYAY